MQISGSRMFQAEGVTFTELENGCMLVVFEEWQGGQLWWGGGGGGEHSQRSGQRGRSGDQDLGGRAKDWILFCVRWEVLEGFEPTNDTI